MVNRTAILKLCTSVVFELTLQKLYTICTIELMPNAYLLAFCYKCAL